ncbi:hypothetical protein EYF80_015720 [Liparis tanakae]|uniref:Uncharacterized protein n=1 Tax=Liparis tanakae TaxID=230148 RepID=A0A4Z2I7R0_9TELE|nr:hypothetical protein EYF80_015720 [Liparis tanakae]
MPVPSPCQETGLWRLKMTGLLLGRKKHMSPSSLLIPFIPSSSSSSSSPSSAGGLGVLSVLCTAELPCGLNRDGWECAGAGGSAESTHQLIYLGRGRVEEMPSQLPICTGEERRHQLWNGAAAWLRPRGLVRVLKGSEAVGCRHFLYLTMVCTFHGSAGSRLYSEDTERWVDLILKYYNRMWHRSSIFEAVSHRADREADAAATIEEETRYCSARLKKSVYGRLTVS